MLLNLTSVNLVHNAPVELPLLGPSHCPLRYLWPSDTVKSPKNEWGGWAKKDTDVLLDLPSPTPKKQQRVLELSSTPKWNWLDAKPIATWSSLLDFPSYVSTQFLPSQFLSFFHGPTSSMRPLFKLCPWLHFFSFFHDPPSSTSSMIPLLQFHL